MVLLTHIDPTLHMNRWYAVSVQPSLFDACAVVLMWGNRANDYQQMRMLAAETDEAAVALAARWVARKVKRGYVPVGD